MSAPAGFADRFNESMKNSFLGRYFEIEKRNTTFLGELRAGMVAFLTCCYIIPVNSGILSDTGGSCDPAVDCNKARYEKVGDSCKFDGFDINPEWHECVTEVKRNLIAATCIAGMIATMAMAVIARMPLCVAPAMGVNAYFTYNVIGYMQTKMVTYPEALAAAFIEGWIFIIISVTGVRGRIVELIPRNIMFATAAGIGCFLTFIGLQQSEGIGLIVMDGATLTTLGGCPPDERGNAYFMRPVDAAWHDFCWDTWEWDKTDPTQINFPPPYTGKPLDPVKVCRECVFPPGGQNMSNPWVAQNCISGTFLPDVRFGLPAKSANYACFGHQVQSPTMWLGIFGGALMVLLAVHNIKASILYGILFVTFISWIPSSSATYFTDKSQIPGGEERYEYFKLGATVPDVSKTGGKLEFSGLAKADTWIALITFLYLDFLDATSTMFTMARLIAEKVPGFVNEKGQWPRQVHTMCIDGFGIVVGSTLGTSPLTVFAESAVGIREGGHTGITSFVVACGFGISMFLSPIFASIPPYATGPAIVFVGSMMFEHGRHVEWENTRVAVPSFLTIICMPLTYSIAYGVIIGLCSQIFLWVVCSLIDVLTLPFGKTKTFRTVWLDSMSHFYLAFGKEQVLIDELPGYVPSSSAHVDKSVAGDSSVTLKKPSDKAEVKEAGEFNRVSNIMMRTSYRNEHQV